jgi:hypothetical protein
MAARHAWVLNLDADLELGAGAGYEPTRSVRLSMKPHVERLAASLLGPGDVLVDESSPALSAAGLPGRAFCPTARALDVLRRAGADPEPHPSVDVLRRVNSRAFASSLGSTMPGAAFVTALDAARSILVTEPPVGTAWRAKHAFGMTGRNQRVIRPSVSEPDLAFVRAGLTRGGVQIEPHVAIEGEYAIHGVIAADGSFRIGVLVRQRCDARGAWMSTEPIASSGETLGDIPDRMGEEAHRVAHALSGAGFFGPFGIDAYSYRGPGGESRLQPRSEINARYSMGFAVGFNGW